MLTKTIETMHRGDSVFSTQEAKVEAEEAQSGFRPSGLGAGLLESRRLVSGQSGLNNRRFGV